MATKKKKWKDIEAILDSNVRVIEDEQGRKVSDTRADQFKATNAFANKRVTSTTKPKTNNQSKKTEEAPLFYAFSDGFDRGDITKTILHGKRKLFNAVEDVTHAFIEEPLQTVKTIPVAIGKAVDDSVNAIDNTFDDFMDWILKRDDKDKGISVKDYNRVMTTGTQEEKQQLLQQAEDIYGKDSQDFDFYEKLLTTEDNRPETIKTIDNILNPKYYNTDTYKAYEAGELSEGQQRVWEISESIGHQLPSMGATMLTGNPLVGRAVFFTQAQQNYTEEAKTRGYTDADARKYGLIMGGAETLVESLGFDQMGGLKKLSSSSITKATIGEGLEEFVMPYIDSTVKSVGFDEEFDLISTSEEAVEGAVMGAITGAIMNAGGKGLAKVDNFVNKVNTGQEITQEDFVEAGKELEQADPNAIKEALEGVPEVVKQEKQKQKQQTYQYVPKDTDSEQRRTLGEDASKYANNTSRTQEVIDLMVNVNEASGIKFRIANNQSELIASEKKKLIENYAKKKNVSIEEATKRFEKTTIDAYNNGEIVINTDSDKYLNRLVGHEVTHSLEGTKEYTRLQKLAREYAITKKDYDARMEKLEALYEGTNANVDNEFTSEIVGDYLFSDQEFINRIHAEDRNLFQRIYDEIKHLYKMATAGSKEARQLEQLQHSFEKAMRENKENITNPKIEIVEPDVELRGVKINTKNYEFGVGFPDLGKTIQNGIKQEQEYLNDLINETSTKIVESEQVTKRTTPSQEELDNLEDIRLNKSGSEYADAFYSLEKKYGKANLYKGLNSYKTTGKVLDTEYSLTENKYAGRYADGTEEQLRQAERNLNSNIARLESTVANQEKMNEIGKGQFNERLNTNKNSLNELKLQYEELQNEFKKRGITTQYSLTDNQGRELSKKQIEKFKDSKVRDENGKLLTLYHTTDSKFTVFDVNKFGQNTGGMLKGIYLSTEPLGNYGDYTIECYANITNPATVDSKNITKEQFIKLLEEKVEKNRIENAWRHYQNSNDLDILYAVQQQYRANRNYQNNQEFYDKVKEITGYDGALYSTDRYYANGRSAYVAFNSNQIKNVDNLNPTDDPDIRYSLSETGNTGTLMAIHNLNEKKLQGIIELGGFPVPSIAITNTENVGSNQFGNITVLFDKNTIDPANRKNEVYDRDAWTPTFPSVEYEIDNSKLKAISKNLGLSNIPYDNIVSDATISYFYEENIGERINSRGLESVIEEIKDSKSMKYAYLRATDSTFEPVMKTKEFSNEYSNETLQRFLDNYKSDTPIKELDYEQTLAMAEQIKEAIKPELEQSFGSNKRFGQELINKTLESFDDNFSKIDNFIHSAKQLQRLGNEHQIIDEKASLDKASEVINTEEYNKWVEDNFKDIVSNKGIRNDKDLFTASGNRRSFNQTHDEYNLSNIVRLMIKGRTTGGQKGFFAGGFGTISANMSHQFTSIEDIKSRESQIMTNAEAVAVIEPLRDKLQSDIEELAKYYDTYESNPFIKFDRVNDAVLEFSEKKTTNVATFKKVLDSWHGYKNVPTKVMQAIVDDLNALKTIPTDYFEAKPQRAVGLDEVQAIVIPNDTSTEFKQQLQDAGLKYYEYDRNIEGDRQRVINQFDELKFSLSNEENNVAPTSADIHGSEIRVQVEEAIAPLKEEITQLKQALESDIAPMTEADLPEYEKQRSRDFQAMTDADAPTMLEDTTPDVIPDNVTVDDPFYDRDIKEVGNKKVKAYMYENPEVKPFFQQTAREMLGDLDNSIKGEKLWLQEFNPVTKMYETSQVTGTKRMTTDDIAELLDTYHYTYDQIRKGLNAIIEDNGKENIAVAKRIEFMLNDRLLYGYKSVDGLQIPANEQYQALIRDKNIQEYTQQAYEEWNKGINQDELAPSVSNSEVEAKNEPKIVQKDAMAIFESPLNKQLSNEMKYTKSEPKVNKTKTQMLGDAFGKFREQFFNSFHYVDKYARDTGNKQIKFNTDMLNNVYAEIDGELNTAQTDIYGNPIGEAVLQPFIDADNNGELKALNDYLFHFTNIDRHLVGKGSEVPLEVSRQKIAEYDKTNPNLRGYSERVWRSYKNDLAVLEANGLISRQRNMSLQSMYPHYNPMMFAKDFVPPMENDNVARPNSPIKRAEGGAFEILEMVDARIKYTQSVRRAIRMNDVLKEIVHTSDKNIEIGADDRIDPTDIDRGFGVDDKGNYFATAYIDGQMQQAVISEDMYRELKQEGKHRMRALEDRYSIITKPLQWAGKVRRNLLTTWSPTFMVTNPMKDIQDASFNSKYTKDFAKHYPTALFELGQAKTKVAKQFLTLYGTGNTFGEYDSAKYINQKNGKFLNNVVNAVPKFNNLVELAPRFAEFKASLDNGATIQEAMYNAREVTVNFGRGGYVAKALNRNGFTFFNASLQGFDKLARNFSGENGAKGVVGALAKVAVLGVAPSVFNALAFGAGGDDEDEDYKALPDYIKDNYYLIKTGDGEFIRIPKGRMLSIFGSAGRRTLEAMRGEENAFEGYLTNAYSQVGVQNPLESNIFAPLLQAYNNETWYGGDLVPTRLQDKPVEEQYDESTDEFSKWLGQNIGISPYKINYVIDQYSGGIGDLILPTITEEAQSDGSLLAPIKDKFTANSTFDNRYASDFYSLKDEIEVKANGSKASEEDILKSEYLTSVSYEMSELYKEKRAVQSDTSLTKTEKFEKVEAIQDQINSLAEEAINGYENISKTSTYAMVNDREYYKNSEGEWWKPNEDELDELNSYGMDLDDKTAYFEAKNQIYEINQKYQGTEDTYDDRKRDIIKVVKNSHLSTDYKSYLYGKYYSEDTTNIVNMLNIDFDEYLDYESQYFVADKDKNGKSISGSKKAKVFNYINNMDISFEEKVILAKLQYNTYDEWNVEIIEYLNNSDISYEEMEFILTQMGFIVDKDGYIYWE